MTGEKPSLSNRVARAATSGPLLALAFLGLVFAFSPQDLLFLSPSYPKLFAVIPQWLWSVGCIALAGVGYYGLYTANRKAWKAAHGTAIGLFIPMAFFYAGQASSFTASAFCLALALNAWARYAGLYREFPLERRQ